SPSVYKIIGADSKEYGPITAEVLRQWIAEGRVNGQTKVLSEGQTDWKTIAEVPELVRFLDSTSAPATVPATISLTPLPRNNSYAVSGLTLGILSLTFGVCCCYGFPFSIPGVICSSIALSQIKNDPVSQQGRGLAMAGLVLSLLSLLLGGLLIITHVAI